MEAAAQEMAAEMEEAAAAAAAPADVAVVTPETFAAMVEDAVASGDAAVQITEDEAVVSEAVSFRFLGGRFGLGRKGGERDERNSPVFFFLLLRSILFCSKKPLSKKTQQDAIMADVKEVAEAEVGAVQAAVRLSFLFVCHFF